MNIHKKFFSKIGFSYLIFGISTLIIGMLIITVIGIINPGILKNFNALTIITAICNYVLPFPILLFLMRKMEKQDLEKQKLSLKKFLLYLSITFTLMWIGNLIGIAITSAIGGLFNFEITNPVHTLLDSTDIWLNITLISIIGPIFEEIFFRKLLIDRTIKYGAKVSIILSAVIFGFFHGNISQFFYVFLLGGFFAYVYIKTGKIIYTIILHITVNLMGSVISTFAIKSLQALFSNSYGAIDLAVVAIYTLIVILTILFGLIGLSMFKKAKFNGSKTQIALKHPLKTSLLNPGVICFIIFYSAVIIFNMIT